MRTEWQFKLREQTGVSDVLWEGIPTSWGSLKVWRRWVENGGGEGQWATRGVRLWGLCRWWEVCIESIVGQRGSEAVGGLGGGVMWSLDEINFQGNSPNSAVVFSVSSQCLYFFFFFTGFGELLWCTHDSQTDPPCYPDQGAEGNAVRQTHLLTHRYSDEVFTAAVFWWKLFYWTWLV